MSKQMSSASKNAMVANDRHGAVDSTPETKDTHSNVRGQEHTKPQGNLRDVADKADSHNAYRGDFNRGH